MRPIDGSTVVFSAYAADVVPGLPPAGFTYRLYEKTFGSADTTAPGITLVTPAEGATYDLAEPVVASYSCSDDVAVATCAGDVADGAAIPTSTPGAGSFTVDATDATGNAANVTRAYTVSSRIAAGLGFTGQVTGVPAGWNVEVTDAADPADGVRVTVTGTGSGQVTISACGGFTVKLGAGASATLTCGSVIAKVHSGTLQIVTPSGTTVVDLDAGDMAEVEDTGAVQNLGSSSVVVATGGTTVSVPGGQNAAYRMVGFTAPVDMGGVINTVKGGSTVPIRFEAFYGTVEITDPAVVEIASAVTQCGTGTVDAIEEVLTSGSTQLRYQDGHFALNWKTPKAANTCRTFEASAGSAELKAVFRLK